MGTTSCMGDWIKPEAVMSGVTSWLALMNKKTTRTMLLKIIVSPVTTTWCDNISRYNSIMNSPPTSTANDRLPTNDRLHKCTSKRNALPLPLTYICTDKRPDMQWQRNALIGTMIKYKETRIMNVEKVQNNKKNKIINNIKTLCMCKPTSIFFSFSKTFMRNKRLWPRTKIGTLSETTIVRQPGRQEKRNAPLIEQYKEISVRPYNASLTYLTKHKEANTKEGNSTHKDQDYQTITFPRNNISTIRVIIMNITGINSNHTACQVRFSKPPRGLVRSTRDAKRTLEPSTTKIFSSGYQTIECNYMSNYRNMVISTRDVFAVTMALTLATIFCITEMYRPYKIRRTEAQKLREPTRQRNYTSYTEHELKRLTIHERHYRRNYHYVEISTRDVFAVITAINIIMSLNTNRISKLRRSECKGSRAAIQFLKIESTITIYAGSKRTRDNYPNYHNVVISTRDESAVNTPKIVNSSGSLLCQLFKLAQRNVTTTKVRISKKIAKYQNLMQNNTLLYRFREFFANYDYPPRQRGTKPFTKIWLLKQRAIVDMTHRNEINPQFRGRYVCQYKIKKLLRYEYKFAKKFKGKNSRNTLLTDCIDINDELVTVVRPVTECIKPDTKCMVLVPLRSFYSRSWNSKHCKTVTTITKTTILKVWKYNKTGNMETQRAVEHIPGPSENSAELRDLEAFIQSQTPIQSQTVTPSMNQQNEDEYEYDPVNDCMKRKHKSPDNTVIRSCQEARQSEGVGEGRQCSSTSTGKLYNRKIKKASRALYSNFFTAGTEPQTVLTQDDTNGKSKKRVTFSNDDCNVTTKHKSTGDTSAGVVIAPDHLPPRDSEIDAQLSCSFSEEDTEDDRQDVTANSTNKGEGKTAGRKIPKCERVDARIQAQKNALWNNRANTGKDEDPRNSALIPIHAPSMERMQIAQLEALKQRAENAEKNKKKEGVVQEILYGMNNLAEINYSVVPVRAEFVTEAEILPNTNSKIITATNDPLTVRPKPPSVKKAREQKVPPFPKGRKQAVKRHLETNRPLKLSESDSDEILSDESWPTDKDESIVAWKQKKTVRTKTRSETPKPQQKSKIIKKPRVTKPKKLTKAATVSMVQKIREPEPRSLSTSTRPGDSLDRKAVQSLVKILQSRLRQKAYRARQAQKKIAEKNTVTGVARNDQTETDVLAQAISLSNILNPEENMALDELILEEDNAILDSDDNEALDELLMEVTMEAESNRNSDMTAKMKYTLATTKDKRKEKISNSSSDDTSSNSSSNSYSSSSSSSGSSCSESDSSVSSTDSELDNVWGSSTRMIRNPFARKQPLQPLPAPVTTYPAHQGYFTQQGLKLQKLKLSKLREKAGLSKNSVPVVSLNRQDIKNFLSKYHSTQTQVSTLDSPNANANSNNIDTHTLANDSSNTTLDPNMSAKNISKDRSGRPDNAKQDRFTKGRGNAEEEEEEMDHEETTGQEGTGKEDRSKGNSKRSREPPRTGNHDNTTTEDSDDELPSAKRSVPSLREKLTQVYQRKTKETRTKLDGERATPSVEFKIDVTHAGEKVKTPSVPLLTPTTIAEAPTLSLKDLVPEQDQQDLDGHGQPESFKTDRIEFVIVERELDETDGGANNQSDRDYEWEIPDRGTFDAVIGQAIDKFTEDDWDRIDYVTFSSVGWNTGVGLFAFGSDKLVQMSMFRDIVRSIEIGNKRFESYPKRMLLNRYALTIYFNAAFQYSTAPKLLFFFKKLNGFEGDLTIAETRFYPDNHPTRKGCKIIACEADQRFLDELYKYPKDHAFNIRYGGNLYVRGGERIDPDDPNAVRPRRPKLTRTAAKKFIHGAGEDILNEGQKADDEAARRAREDHLKKHVGYTVLFEVCLNFQLILFRYAKYYVLGSTQNALTSKRIKKHCVNGNTPYRESESSLRNSTSFYLLKCKGNGKEERCLCEATVHIFERNKVDGEEKFNYVTMYHHNDVKCMNLPMPIMTNQLYLCITNYKCKLNKHRKSHNDLTLQNKTFNRRGMIGISDKSPEPNVTRPAKVRRLKYRISYRKKYYYLAMISTRAVCILNITIKHTKRLKTCRARKIIRKYKSGQLGDYNSTSKQHVDRYSYARRLIDKGNYVINYRVMVISTRDVSTVIKSSKFITSHNISNMPCLAKLRYNEALIKDDFKQIMLKYTNLRIEHSIRLSFELNNYLIMVISTRDEATVITAIKPLCTSKITFILSPCNINRPVESYQLKGRNFSRYKNDNTSKSLLGRTILSNDSDKSKTKRRRGLLMQRKIINTHKRSYHVRSTDDTTYKSRKGEEPKSNGGRYKECWKKNVIFKNKNKNDHS